MLTKFTIITTLILGFVFTSSEVSAQQPEYPFSIPYGEWVEFSEGIHAGYVVLRNTEGSNIRVDVYHDGGRFVVTKDCKPNGHMMVLSTDGDHADVSNCNGKVSTLRRGEAILQLLDIIRHARTSPGPAIRMYILKLVNESKN